MPPPPYDIKPPYREPLCKLNEGRMGGGGQRGSAVMFIPPYTPGSSLHYILGARAVAVAVETT